MSAIGTKRTFQPHPRLSAIGVTTDIAGFRRGTVCPLMTQSGHWPVPQPVPDGGAPGQEVLRDHPEGCSIQGFTPPSRQEGRLAAILNLMDRARADEIIRRKAESEHRTHPTVDEDLRPWRGA